MSIQTIPTEYFVSNTLMQPNGCIEWQGKPEPVGGYGVIGHKKKRYYTHRVSWAKFRGEIPDGLMVCHRCDNRRCVNPNHLFLGTGRENIADRDAKGRMCRGHRQHLSRLTLEQVLEIRRGGKLLRECAHQYGVSIPSVWAVLKRATWKHV